jgi:hypothetical protein
VPITIGTRSQRILLFLASSLVYSSGFAGTPQMLGDAANGTQVLHVFEQWTSAYEEKGSELTIDSRTSWKLGVISYSLMVRKLAFSGRS